MAQLNAPRLSVPVIKGNTVEMMAGQDTVYLNATAIVSHLIAYSP